jgi:hypothetical protein
LTTFSHTVSVLYSSGNRACLESIRLEASERPREDTQAYVPHPDQPLGQDIRPLPGPIVVLAPTMALTQVESQLIHIEKQLQEHYRFDKLFQQAI